MLVVAGSVGKAGAAVLCVEVNPERIRRRLETRYLDEAVDSLEEALVRIRAAAREGRAVSIGLLGNAADVVPELARVQQVEVVLNLVTLRRPPVVQPLGRAGSTSPSFRRRPRYRLDVPWGKVRTGWDTPA